MQKNVKVHYPKRKILVQEDNVQGIQEPERETMYDVVLRNFEIADRKTFLHRIIYVGEHSFPKDEDLIVECFEKSINLVNGSHCFENLTGFFLFYKKYFVHMVEGDEDAINDHLGILLHDTRYKKYLGVIKLLIHVSHISRRYISNWNHYYGVPSKLLGQIDPNSSLEDSGRQAYNCIKKVYNLVASFVDDNYCYTPGATQRSIVPDSLNAEALFPLQHISSVSQKSRISNMSFRTGGSSVGLDPYRAFLPEIEVLEFIINSSFTQHLKDYYSKYGVVPQRDIYKDKVWPVPSDFVPYDVFSKPYDTITELPKTKSIGEKKQENIETDEADQSDEEDVVDDRAE